MDKTLATALNEQYNRERGNAAFYEAMANWFDNQNWTGFEDWARDASKDELHHAKAFRKFIQDRNEAAIVAELPAPPQIAGDVVSVFTLALNAEQSNSAAIRELHYLAEQVEDPETCAFLIPWLLEQVKSERELTEIVAYATRAGGDEAALMLLEKRLK